MRGSLQARIEDGITQGLHGGDAIIAKLQTTQCGITPRSENCAKSVNPSKN